jgi:tyrosinase
VGETHTFQFTVRDAGNYRVETFGQLDTIVTLFGPGSDSRMVAKDDDSGRSLNARIVANLTPGEYILRVRHFSAHKSGVYEIAVNRDSETSQVYRRG